MSLCLGEENVSNVVVKYLHVAILISVGEDVPLNVSERSDPVQNSSVQRHICCLQVLRGIDVCGLECKSEWIKAQEQGSSHLSLFTKTQGRNCEGHERKTES